VASTELFLPTVVIFELQVGIAKSGFPTKRITQFEKFVSYVNIIPFGKNEAHHAALVRAHLEKIGKPIGCIDVLIAGIALANHATLVTHNVKEFSRVEGLDIVDWY
jgi:tRNA(fMet)-specific endonuclease VapC